MKLVLFIGWVVFIFICSDFVGSALRFRLSFLPVRRASATDHDTGERGAAVDFVHSTLLGFAALWVCLSVAYAIGIATQYLIVAFIGLAAVAAALAQYRNFISLARSRLTLWGLVGATALLASFVTPTFNRFDDPEYFFLINKLLRIGSIVEYFNYRRPGTLGGWTFIQAIFSAGPAGTAFVASIDAIAGSILFLFCTLLLGIGTLAALPAALSLVLVVSFFQVNLGTAIAMAAMCAVLVSLSLPASAPRNSLTPIALAVMAVTIRPQLGLIAIIGIAVVLWRNRSTLLIVGAVLVGITTLWVVIFLRDTGLLPLSMSPGLNPQVFKQIEDPLLYQTSLLSQVVASFWQDRWAAGSLSLTVLAVVICGWQSVLTKHSAAIRNEFRVLGAFSIAVAATVVVMVAALRPVAQNYVRYYIPVVEGFLYVFWIRSAVHVVQRGLGGLSRYASLPFAVMAVALCVAIVVSAQKLSVPAESSGRICPQLLSPEERRAFEVVPRGSGYTLLAINCPVGSFDTSSRVMMNDLFFATQGDYFDIASDAQGTAKWLRKEGVDRLVYLDKDTSPSFGPRTWRNFLKELKSDSSESARWTRREFSYVLESLEKLRKLAQYCESLRIPIRDPQGPLVIVDVRECKNRDPRPGRLIHPGS
jgi:hypothetical protein